VRRDSLARIVFADTTNGARELGFLHAFPEEPRIVLGTGFCGAYTTFSTFSFETLRQIEEGAWNEALRNAAGTLITGAVAAAAGLALAAI
jgi:fluoride exporter